MPETNGLWKQSGLTTYFLFHNCNNSLIIVLSLKENRFQMRNHC